MTDPLTIKDTINAVIGFFIGVAGTYVYEFFRKRMSANKYRSRYKKLESRPDQYDYQHWNITNGKIVGPPIAAFARLEYDENSTFKFTWTEPGSDQVKGNGFIFFR